MKRPFLLILILLIVNIFFMLNFSFFIALGVTLLLSTILILLFDYKILFISIFALIIALYVFFSVNTKAIEYNDVTISGKVIEYSINNEEAFILKGDYIIKDSQKQEFHHKVLIKYKEDFSQLIGNDVILKVNLLLPHKNTNPNQFNYQNYLNSLGINYIANLTTKNIKEVNKKAFSIEKSIYNYRKKLSNHFEKVYSANTLAFIKGFIYGDKTKFTADQLEAFYNVGLGHILVVSGLHFGILFVILQLLLSKINLNQIHKLIIINIILIMFLGITGFKISSIRAFLMIISLESIYMIDRRLDVLNFISFLSILILLVNPFSIYSISFILSFGAIFSIALFYNKFNKILPDFLSIVLSVQIIIGLINIHTFNQINFATLLINIPINMIVVILYALILLNIILYPVQIITLIITWVINKIFLLVNFLDKQKFMKIILPSFSKWEIILILCIAFALILNYEKKKIKYRNILYVFLIGLLMLNSVNLLNRNLKIYFYDVKSGDSIFISTPQKNKVLIDTGRDDSYNLIGDILLKNSIKDIDMLFLTHNHNDHIGGIENLLKSHRVNYLFIPKYSSIINDLDEMKELFLKDTKIIYLQTGDQIKYDGLVLTVLNPTNNSLNENNQSLVLDVKYGEYDMLFTGDIEKEIESNLIEQLSRRYDILKVPHHGSETSSTKNFVNQIKPLYSVIQVGKNNYGHPNKDVIKKYQDIDSQILRTDLDGCIIFELGQKIKINTLIVE